MSTAVLVDWLSTGLRLPPGYGALVNREYQIDMGTTRNILHRHHINKARSAMQEAGLRWGLPVAENSG